MAEKTYREDLIRKGTKIIRQKRTYPHAKYQMPIENITDLNKA